MSYILILLTIIGSQHNITHIEYTSKAACELAGVNFKQAAQVGVNLSSVSYSCSVK